MKILYVITKSNWGGAQRYVYDLATSFAEKGIDCSVMYGGTGKLHDALVTKGVRTFPLITLTRDISLFGEVRALWDFYSVIRSEMPDILHLNSSKASGLGALIGRMLGVPCIVVTMHGAPFREDRGFVAKKLMYFFTWLTCVLAHKVITVSKQDEADIGAMLFVHDKVTTVYLGIDYKPKATEKRQREKDIRIVTVGELTKNKGHVYGLEAAMLLKEKGVPFRYSVIGEGEDRKTLEAYIHSKGLQTHVELLGFQNARDVLHLYDVYLLPSIKEGLPYILLEAGSATMPVVATITGGVPEIVRHGETGLLAPVKDAKMLAELLEKLAYDRHYGKRLAQNLHSHIVQHFTYSKMIVETAKVYGLVEGKALEKVTSRD